MLAFVPIYSRVIFRYNFGLRSGLVMPMLIY